MSKFSRARLRRILPLSRNYLSGLSRGGSQRVARLHLLASSFHCCQLQWARLIGSCWACEANDGGGGGGGEIVLLARQEKTVIVMMMVIMKISAL